MGPSHKLSISYSSSHFKTQQHSEVAMIIAIPQMWKLSYSGDRASVQDQLGFGVSWVGFIHNVEHMQPGRGLQIQTMEA